MIHIHSLAKLWGARLIQSFGSVILSRNNNWKDNADAGLGGVQVAASGDSTLLAVVFSTRAAVSRYPDLFANIAWLSSLLILAIFFLLIISKTVYFLINLLGLGQNLCKTSRSQLLSSLFLSSLSFSSSGISNQDPVTEELCTNFPYHWVGKLSISYNTFEIQFRLLLETVPDTGVYITNGSWDALEQLWGEQNEKC